VSVKKKGMGFTKTGSNGRGMIEKKKKRVGKMNKG